MSTTPPNTALTSLLVALHTYYTALESHRRADVCTAALSGDPSAIDQIVEMISDLPRTK